MGIFSFIETFFFLSLAISFVLILLLVYHFKQRISLLEKKNDTMITIINDIAKEMTMIKCNCACNNDNACNKNGMNYSSMFGSSSSGGVCMMPSSFEIYQELNIPNNSHEIIELSRDEEDDDEEEDDDDDDDEDDDDEDDDDDEEDILGKIIVSDNEETEKQESEINIVSESEIYQEPVSYIISNTNKEEEEKSHERRSGDFLDDAGNMVEASNLYHKMSLSALKQLVISKNLCADPSKMKKQELLQLIGIGTQGSNKTS